MVLLFPGQGSVPSRNQVALARATPLGRELLELAGRETEVAGGDFFARGGQLLDNTAVTQPLIVAVSVALGAAVLERWQGAGPAVTLLGHSLGELSALAVAGVLTGQQAVQLAATRGRAMAAAARSAPGVLVALHPEQLPAAQRAAAAHDAKLWIALDNAPDELVVACGEPIAGAVLRATGGTKLRVQGAWHCPLMAAAVQPVRAALEQLTLEPPALRVISCIGASPLEAPTTIADAAAARSCLLRGLTETVRFREALQLAATRRFVIAGPGATLRALLRRSYGSEVELTMTETQRTIGLSV